MRHSCIPWVGLLVVSACSDVTDDAPTGFPRIVAFSSDRARISPGESVELVYAVENADLVEITPSALTPPRTTLQGTVRTATLSQTTTFTLFGFNQAGMVKRSLTVVVETSSNAVRIVEFRAVRDTQHASDTWTLSWRTENATHVRLETSLGVSVAGNLLSAGELSVSPTETTTYVLVADGVGGPATAEVVVEVAQPDQTPPTITFTRIADGQLAGFPVTARAQVTDAASGVASVTLYYRSPAAPSFSAIVMQIDGLGDYLGTIPGAAVTGTNVEYYLEAFDGASPQNRAALPARAPAEVLQFSVTTEDRLGPVISHTPIADGQTAGGAILVNADVTDPSGVASVTLYFRTQGQLTFRTAAMTVVGSSYSGVISAADVKSPGVDYYIEALDATLGQNVSRLPGTAPATFLSFAVTTVDNHPPQVAHVPVASPQPPNTAVTIAASVLDASGVASVELFWRHKGESTFATIAMTGGPNYSATLMGSEVIPRAIEYYIRATDAAPARNAANTPGAAPGSPLSFLVGIGEREPNNIAPTATSILRTGELSNLALGAIAPTQDRDYWRLTIPASERFYNLRADVTSGGANACPAPIATTLRLFAADGVVPIAMDVGSGVQDCARLDPTTNTAVRGLRPGNYYISIEETGNNAAIAAYELDVELTASRCGNGLLETGAGEQCDDADIVSGDGCSSGCTWEPEGVVNGASGIFSGEITPAGDVDVFLVEAQQGQHLLAEVTDGASGCPGDLVLDLYGSDGTTKLGSDEDDGPGLCPRIDPVQDSFARRLSAGRYYLLVRASNAGATIQGYRLSISLMSALCGDGEIQNPEECDDNNTRSLDGCDATCHAETAGTATGASARFSGSISPIGNRDWYAISVPAGHSLSAEVFVPNESQCAQNADTLLSVFASNRVTEIAKDDDDGVADCSRLDPRSDHVLRNMGAGTYYLVVESTGLSTTIANYVLKVDVRGPECGNGWVEQGEACDDNNTRNQDGCSSACAFEGPGETEPNDGPATATSMPVGLGLTRAFGQIGAQNDVDVYAISVSAGASVWAEVTSANGRCTRPMSLRLRGPTPAATSLVLDTGDGPGECGQISPGRDRAARYLSAGIYYLEVTGASPASSGAVYRLTARVLSPGCGDFVLSVGERCDDGNTVNGDGCASTCTLEGPAEIEPNQQRTTATVLIANASSTATASARGTIANAQDTDYFSVRVPNRHGVWAEISDGNGRCPNNAMLTIRDSGGSVLATSSSDGPGNCGRLSPIIDPGVDDLIAGTYYVEVTGIDDRTEVYTLRAGIVEPATCGNGIVGNGEGCDDGNRRNGDGCSSTCLVENEEREPNGRSTTANVLASGVTMIGGDATTGDEDWFRIDLGQPATLELRVHEGAIDQCGMGGDPFLELVASDGTTVIASDDDAGPGRCSLIETGDQPLEPGTYYVRVTAWGFGTTYVLHVIERREGWAMSSSLTTDPSGHEMSK